MFFPQLNISYNISLLSYSILELQIASQHNFGGTKLWINNFSFTFYAFFHSSYNKKFTYSASVLQAS